jgi:lipoprotein-releasing system permease protein
LLKYGDRQAVATLKGVGPEFERISGIDTMLMDGEFKLEKEGVPMGVMGQELAGQLGIGLNFINPVHVYVPRRTDKIILDPSRAISHRYLYPSGVFAVQQEYDSKYFIVPLDFARDVFGYKNEEMSAIEVGLTGTVRTGQVRSDIARLFGDGYEVAGRLEQHTEFYRVMASEKWAIFLILGFILIIASFNTISSLTLLMLEKRPDMQMIQGLGATRAAVRRIFLWEGVLVTGIGMISGLILGALVCLLQQWLGIVRFPSSGSFVVDIYPVRLLFTDFLVVTGMVGLVGLLAAWVPLRVMKKRYFAPGSADE